MAKHDDVLKNEKKEQIEQAAIVAHQIKSPINTLQTILRTILGGFAGELNERQRTMLQSADGKASEAMDTVKGLLALSDAVGRHGGQAAADLVSALRHGVERYRAAAADKHLEFILQVELEEAWVGTSPAALQETVAAIIENAVKYTPDGGRIVARVADGGEGQVAFSVSDSGIGVHEKEWARLFQPFFRAANAKKLGISGTGLGLAFVHAVITAAQGTVKAAKSDLGGVEVSAAIPRVARPKGADARHPAHGRKAGPRVVVVGGVAAGPKIASRVMRLLPGADVTIIESGRVLSYAGCGLPFYISGKVKDQSLLVSIDEGVVRGPEYFERVKNIRVLQRTEALEIDRQGQRVRVKDLVQGTEQWIPYDKLALATGALPIVPAIPGVGLKNVYTLHGLEHAEGIRAVASHRRAVDVTIVGAGLIGVEMTESLVEAGCRVTLVELQSQILQGFDGEMAEHVRRYFGTRGVRILVSTRVTAFEGDGRVERVVSEHGTWPADMVIMGAGVRPNSGLAKEAGLEVFPNGGIQVDEHMRTSDPNIFAAGDCVQCRDMITGRHFYAPFGGNANRQGRVAADNISGRKSTFPGVLGTAVCKVFDMTVARTGLTERLARELGYDVVTALLPALDRAHFMPNAAPIMIKLIADAKTRKLLGMQAIGYGEVAKRMDVAVTALTGGLTADDVANLDLSYAPSYSNALDNIHTACNIIRDKLDGCLEGISPVEVRRKLNEGGEIVFLDVRTHAEFEDTRLEGCIHIPLPVLRARAAELPRDKEIVVYSQSSLSAYEASIILRAEGFRNVKVLDGGLMMWPYDTVTL